MTHSNTTSGYLINSHVFLIQLSTDQVLSDGTKDVYLMFTEQTDMKKQKSCSSTIRSYAVSD